MARIKIITNFVTITNRKTVTKATSHTMEALAEMLQHRGIRPTAQRMAVLAAVANDTLHPSAEEIYASLSQTFSTLS